MAAAAVRAVSDVVGSAVQVHSSLEKALQKCTGEDVTQKQWAVIERTDGTLVEIQKALAKGHKQLGIVVVVSQGPVKQLEVLRAMEYGEAFAAAAELRSELAGRALKEAAAYGEGPAVLLLAEPQAVQNDDQWTPFRYDPRREAAGQAAFVAEGPRVRRELEAFLARESLLTLVAKKSMGTAGGEEAEGGDLSQGLADASKTVTILYTSDTGHAEECAKAVARQCRGGGYASSAVRCGTLDSYDVAGLASEPLLVLCIATAGKGEFPGNGRGFWSKITERASELKGTLTNLKYTVFGLGDSHYWGKGTEESKVNFAKPARELDELMESLGAQRFMPLGFGDDQDVDQYHTGFGEWKSQLYSRLGVDKADSAGAGDDGPVKSDEVIKTETRQLRGSLKEQLDDIGTGQVPFQDTKVIKFHGSYQQDDRDLREERQKLGLENAFSFMIRVRLPGGYCSAEQWLAMDDIAGTYANGTLKITTRQTWQLHGVLKRDVKNTMRGINRACMDTIAACGDVCRNVLCTSNPSVCSRELMEEIMGHTYAIHDHCLPRTGAYHEIFLMHGEEMAEKCQVLGSTPIEEEPLYGLTYLPRKFKVAVAIPPSNDVDVFAHCCGFIAIIEGGKLQGYNVTVGGGLGFTHNNQKTFPRPTGAAMPSRQMRPGTPPLGAVLGLALGWRAAAQNGTDAQAPAWNHTLLSRGRDHADLVTKYEGVEWPALNVAQSSSSGETHVFAIGDWGTLLPGHFTAPNTRPTGSHHKCPNNCEYVHGVDDRAQLLVASAMKRRAASSNPQYVLNAGDSFYWGGITQPCGGGFSAASGLTVSQFAQVWQSVYGPLADKPWLSALGNHDYGGYQFNLGWDQQIAYSHRNPNWVMPARYFSRKMHHPGFTVEYFIIDSNAFDAKAPGEDPEHNICGAAHNPPGASCASIGGPTSVDDCRDWFWSSYRRQQTWLEGRLAASTADWQVVVTHFPCHHDSAWYQMLHARHGLDLLVTGHRHAQELHSVGGLACFVTGGGGGVTSEQAPVGADTRQYGFFDLTLSREAIKIELVNFHGNVVDSTTVRPKHRLLLL